MVPRHCDAVCLLGEQGLTVYDPNNTADMQDLARQIPRDFEKLEHWRKGLRDTVNSITGDHYKDPDTADPNLRNAQPANFNGMATDIFVRSLVSANPRVYATTDYRELTVMTETFEYAINDRFEEMCIVDQLEAATYDAVLGPMATVIVGRERQGFLNETSYPRSKTVCRRISLDVQAWDTDARQWSECGYETHKLRIREDEFMRSKAFPQKLKDAIQPRHLYEARDADTSGEPLIEDMSVNKSDLPVGRGRRYIMLWYVYLPTSRSTLYIPCSYDSVLDLNPAMAVRRWVRQKGPYKRYGFDLVPDNLAWRSPVKDSILDVGLILNDLVYRIMADARDRKKVGIVDALGDDTIDRINNARHGDFVAGRADAAKTVESGGLDNLTMLAFVQLHKLWDELGGNISILGGLTGAYPTATEANVRNTNASGKIEKMRQRSLRWVDEVATAVAQYEWEDPDAGRILERELYGGVKRRLDFSYIKPRGSFERWRINVHPYSLQYRSPTQVVQMMDQFVGQIIIPSLPLFQQAGVTFDIQAYAKTRSKLLDMPFMSNLLVPTSRVDQTQAGTSYQPGKAPVTERIETRRSEAQGDEMGMMRLLSAMGRGANYGDAA